MGWMLLPGTVGLHICFDEQGREIEVLDVTRVDKDIYRIEETPIFLTRGLRLAILSE
ncbi:hypothetical protein ACFTAO_17380 [Paenibacillus rhizoplanae]